MVKLIYVMRHGQSTVNLVKRLTNQPTGDLTDLGREQAAKAGEWLRDKQITTIFASPYERTQATAQIIGTALGLPIAIEDGLREVNCGHLDGRDDPEALTLFSQTFQRWKDGHADATFPGGEARYMGEARYGQALARAHSVEGNVLLVTHGGITSAILPYLCVNAAALQRTHRLANTAFVVLEPFDNLRYICKSWGLVDHLTPASPNE